MKIRLDFVTNSSTSSYICNVCGELQSGRDLGLSDAEMIECVNSHVVCESHLTEIPDDVTEEFPYEVPSEFCPICSLKHVRDKDILDYVLKSVFTGGREGQKARIRKRFVSLEALRAWCDEDKK